MVVGDDQSRATDRELVERFQRTRDQGAFDELVARHSGRAYQQALAFLGNREDAEEVAQDAFIRIYRSLPKFRGDAEFSTWMYRIVMNLCNNRYRWNKVRGAGRNISVDAPLESKNSSGDAPLKMELPDDRMMPDREVAFVELRDRTEAAMKSLPEVYRQAKCQTAGLRANRADSALRRGDREVTDQPRARTAAAGAQSLAPLLNNLSFSVIRK